MLRPRRIISRRDNFPFVVDRFSVFPPFIYRSCLGRPNHIAVLVDDSGSTLLDCGKAPGRKPNRYFVLGHYVVSRWQTTRWIDRSSFYVRSCVHRRASENSRATTVRPVIVLGFASYCKKRNYKENQPLKMLREEHDLPTYRNLNLLQSTDRRKSGSKKTAFPSLPKRQVS